MEVIIIPNLDCLYNWWSRRRCSEFFPNNGCHPKRKNTSLERKLPVRGKRLAVLYTYSNYSILSHLYISLCIHIIYRKPIIYDFRWPCLRTPEGFFQNQRLLAGSSHWFYICIYIYINIYTSYYIYIYHIIDISYYIYNIIYIYISYYIYIILYIYIC